MPFECLISDFNADTCTPSVTWAGNAKSLISAGYDGYLRWWNLDTGECTEKVFVKDDIQVAKPIKVTIDKKKKPSPSDSPVLPADGRDNGEDDEETKVFHKLHAGSLVRFDEEEESFSETFVPCGVRAIGDASASEQTENVVVNLHILEDEYVNHLRKINGDAIRKIIHSDSICGAVDERGWTYVLDENSLVVLNRDGRPAESVRIINGTVSKSSSSNQIAFTLSLPLYNRLVPVLKGLANVKFRTSEDATSCKLFGTSAVDDAGRVYVHVVKSGRKILLAYTKEGGLVAQATPKNAWKTEFGSELVSTRFVQPPDVHFETSMQPFWAWIAWYPMPNLEEVGMFYYSFFEDEEQENIDFIRKSIPFYSSIKDLYFQHWDTGKAFFWSGLFSVDTEHKHAYYLMVDGTSLHESNLLELVMDSGKPVAMRIAAESRSFRPINYEIAPVARPDGKVCISLANQPIQESALELAHSMLKSERTTVHPACCLPDDSEVAAGGIQMRKRLLARRTMALTTGVPTDFPTVASWKGEENHKLHEDAKEGIYEITFFCEGTYDAKKGGVMFLDQLSTASQLEDHFSLSTQCACCNLPISTETSLPVTPFAFTSARASKKAVPAEKDNADDAIVSVMKQWVAEKMKVYTSSVDEYAKEFVAACKEFSSAAKNSQQMNVAWARCQSTYVTAMKSSFARKFTLSNEYISSKTVLEMQGRRVGKLVTSIRSSASRILGQKVYASDEQRKFAEDAQKECIMMIKKYGNMNLEALAKINTEKYASKIGEENSLRNKVLQAMLDGNDEAMHSADEDLRRKRLDIDAFEESSGSSVQKHVEDLIKTIDNEAEKLGQLKNSLDKYYDSVVDPILKKDDALKSLDEFVQEVGRRIKERGTDNLKEEDKELAKKILSLVPLLRKACNMGLDAKTLSDKDDILKEITDSEDSFREDWNKLQDSEKWIEQSASKGKKKNGNAPKNASHVVQQDKRNNLSAIYEAEAEFRQKAKSRATVYEYDISYARSSAASSDGLGKVIFIQTGISMEGPFSSLSREDAATEKSKRLRKYRLRFRTRVDGGVFKYSKDEDEEGGYSVYHIHLMCREGCIEVVNDERASEEEMSGYRRELLESSKSSGNGKVPEKYIYVPKCGAGKPRTHDASKMDPGTWKDGAKQYRESSRDDSLECVRLSRGGDRVAVGMWNGKCMVYWTDISAGPPKVAMQLNGHLSSVMGAAWSASDEMIATCSMDTSIRIWHGNTGQQLLIMNGHASIVQTIDWCPQTNWIASGGYAEDATAKDGRVFVWDMNNWDMDAPETKNPYMSQRPLLASDMKDVLCVAWAPPECKKNFKTGNYLAISGRNRAANLWKVMKGTLEMDKVNMEHEEKSHIHCVSWTLDGNCIVTGGSDRCLKRWDLALGDSTFVGKHLHNNQIWGLQCAPGEINKPSTLVATSSEDGHIKVWDMASADHDQGMEFVSKKPREQGKPKNSRNFGGNWRDHSANNNANRWNGNRQDRKEDKGWSAKGGGNGGNGRNRRDTYNESDNAYYGQH